MSHFSEDAWFDFAYNALEPEQRIPMQQHLDDGCDQCVKTHEIWHRVITLCRRDTMYDPPETAVASAKALGSQGLLSHFSKIAQTARLLFDSALQPTLVPVRGPLTYHRLLMYESEHFMIDLQLESGLPQKRRYLLGQVLDSTKPDKTFEDVEVLLFRQDTVADRTFTKPSGEFSLEFGDEEGLRLFIKVRSFHVVEIPLPDPKRST